MGRRVVVTGIGLICGVGNTAEEVWRKLLDGKSGVAPITHFDPTQFACRIASLMLGTTYTSLGEDVLDALGEMANQIFGNVKTNLESVLGLMDLGIPTVLYGNNLSARSMVRKAILIPVVVEGHSFTVKVHMAPNTGQAMRAARLCVNVDLAEAPLAL